MKKILMFCLVLTLLSCSKPKAVDPSLKTLTEVEDTVYDFGLFTDADGRQSHTFKIKNTGVNPLVLQEVGTTCGCVVVKDYTKEPVAPGDEAKIKVYYDPELGSHGRFAKDVTVTMNSETGGGFFRFTVRGEHQ